MPISDIGDAIIYLGSVVCIALPRVEVSSSRVTRMEDEGVEVLFDDDAPLDAFCCTFFLAAINAHILKLAALRYIYLAGVVTLRVGMTCAQPSKTCNCTFVGLYLSTRSA